MVNGDAALCTAGQEGGERKICSAFVERHGAGKFQGPSKEDPNTPALLSVHLDAFDASDWLYD